MKESLTVGLRHELTYRVPENKTVPHVFEDSVEFAQMPKVFATAFLVGLLERACIEALLPHLDWPAEQTVGTHINVSHSAATPPGFTITINVELIEVDSRRLVFDVTAHDGHEEVSHGRHERFIINATTFADNLAEKTPPPVDWPPTH